MTNCRLILVKSMRVLMALLLFLCVACILGDHGHSGIRRKLTHWHGGLLLAWLLAITRACLCRDLRAGLLRRISPVSDHMEARLGVSHCRRSRVHISGLVGSHSSAIRLGWCYRCHAWRYRRGDLLGLLVAEAEALLFSRCDRLDLTIR